MLKNYANRILPCIPSCSDARQKSGRLFLRSSVLPEIYLHLGIVLYALYEYL
jgi:hypothetical protein